MKNYLSLLLLVMSVSSGCSSKEGSSEEIYGTGQKTFTAEDKLEAQSLSISADRTSENSSVQYRAILCSLALEAIEERMRDMLTGEQQQAFAQAQSLYSRRAKIGLSEQQHEETMREVEAAYPNQSDRSRFATSCLRKIGQEA